MLKFVSSALSGWLAVFLLCAGASIPRVARALLDPVSFSQCMRGHYRLGWAIPLLAFAHAWIAMSGGLARVVNLAGLWLATAAWLGMLLQAALGASLREKTGADRRTAKRWHFALMALIGASTVAHVVLN